MFYDHSEPMGTPSNPPRAQGVTVSLHSVENKTGITSKSFIEVEHARVSRLQMDSPMLCVKPPVSVGKSDNLGASPAIWKFASFIFSIDDRPEIDASHRQFVTLTIVSVIEKLTVNP